MKIPCKMTWSFHFIHTQFVESRLNLKWLASHHTKPHLNFSCEKCRNISKEFGWDLFFSLHPPFTDLRENDCFFDRHIDFFPLNILVFFFFYTESGSDLVLYSQISVSLVSKYIWVNFYIPSFTYSTWRLPSPTTDFCWWPQSSSSKALVGLSTMFQGNAILSSDHTYCSEITVIFYSL